MAGGEVIPSPRSLVRGAFQYAMSAPFTDLSSIAFDTIEGFIRSGLERIRRGLPGLRPVSETPSSQRTEVEGKFKPDFLSFNCAHCLAQGFARRDGQDAVKIDLEQIRRSRAEVEPPRHS